MIVGIIIGVLIILIAGAGIYFYDFYVFKTVRICIGEAEDTGVQCNSTSDCIELARMFGLDVDLNDMPSFVKENFQKIIDEAIYCDENCMIKEVRGINKETHELESLDSCVVGEEEIVIEIHGREGLEIWKWLKARE